LSGDSLKVPSRAIRGLRGFGHRFRRQPTRIPGGDGPSGPSLPSTIAQRPTWSERPSPDSVAEPPVGTLGPRGGRRPRTASWWRRRVEHRGGRTNVDRDAFDALHGDSTTAVRSGIDLPTVSGTRTGANSGPRARSRAPRRDWVRFRAHNPRPNGSGPPRA